MVFGGIIVGIIATIIYESSKQTVRNILFKRRFKFLVGQNVSWKGYGFKDSNTNEVGKENGASATFEIICDKQIHISVCHSGRKWNGEITMLTENYGKLFFKYTDKEEFGTKDCYFKQDKPRNETILLVPTNNPILSTDGSVKYSYGKELFKKQ